MSDLQIRIGADIQDFNKKLADAVGNIQNFDAVTRSALESTNRSFKSIDQLNTRLDLLSQKLKSATDPKVFSGLQTAIDVTKKRIDLLSGSVGGSFVNGANRGTNALTALGQVARDAPFGFIAIQNNLPILFDQFGSLVRLSGGLKGAFKSLGAALLSPAGITFAIGATIALVTGLIQKYGSLSNAITVLTAKNKEAAKSQIEFNKELAKNESSVKVQSVALQSLLKTYNDSTISQQKRLAAFQQIKKIEPDIVAGITAENALTRTNIELVNARSTAYLNYIKLRAQESAINAVTQKNEEEIIKLTQEQTAEQAKLAQQIKISNLQKGQTKKGFDTYTYNTENFLLESQRKKVEELAAKIKNLENVNKTYYSRLEANIITQGEYLKGVEEEAKRLAEKKKKEDEANAAKEKAIKLTEKELENYKKVKAELQDRGNQIKQGQLDFQSFFDKSEKIINEGGKAVRDAISKTGFEEAIKTAGKVKGGIQIIPSQSVIDAIKNKDKLIGVVKSLSTEIQNVLTVPFEQFFTDLLTKGELNFKAFADAIIKEITRIIAKLIILKIIEKIGNAILPGAGTAVSSVGNFVSDAFGVRAPTIGSAGGLTGGLQLGGQVVFVQRGYDLVGVLNAANGSIRNIG